MKLNRIDYRWAWGIFTVFILYAGWWKFGYHELWKDEWQAWLIAQNTNGLGELREVLRLEGHPLLWFLYLKLSALWTSLFNVSDGLALQISHFMLVLLSAWLWLFKMRLPIWIAFGVIFSFALGYEYAIVSRGYILVVVLGQLSFLELRRKEVRWWLLGLLLFLLCQTEIYGLLLAWALALSTIYVRRNYPSWFRTNRVTLPLFLLLGTAAFAYTVWPTNISNPSPLIAGFAPEFGLGSLQASAGNGLFRGLTGNVFESLGMASGLEALLGLVIIFGLLVLLRAKNQKLILLIVSGGFLLFHALLFTGSQRNWSMIFPFFILLLSIKPPKKITSPLGIVVGLILLVQLVGFWDWTGKDGRNPYSSAGKAAMLLSRDWQEGDVLFGIDQYNFVSLRGEWQRFSDASVFLCRPGQRQVFNFYRWGERVYLPREIELLKHKSQLKAKRLWIASPRELPKQAFGNCRLKHFSGDYHRDGSTLIKPEVYYLYLLE